MTLLAPNLRASASTEVMFRDHLKELSRLAETLAESAAADAAQAVALLVDCLRDGGKILACGNGGSAAAAQHFVAELVGRMLFDRAPLAAVSLTTDTSVLTALGNDYGYDEVFARQVQAIGRPGDALVAISTSGRSPNVIAAMNAAGSAGMTVICLTGEGGEASLSVSDVWLRAGSDTPHTQELHTAILHTLCVGIERTLLGS